MYGCTVIPRGRPNGTIDKVGTWPLVCCAGIDRSGGASGSGGEAAQNAHVHATRFYKLKYWTHCYKLQPHAWPYPPVHRWAHWQSISWRQEHVLLPACRTVLMCVWRGAHTAGCRIAAPSYHAERPHPLAAAAGARAVWLVTTRLLHMQAQHRGVAAGCV